MMMNRLEVKVREKFKKKRKKRSKGEKIGSKEKREEGGRKKESNKTRKLFTFTRFRRTL